MATKNKEEGKKEKKPLTRKQVYAKALKMLDKAKDDIRALDGELAGIGMDIIEDVIITVEDNIT